MISRNGCAKFTQILDLAYYPQSLIDLNQNIFSNNKICSRVMVDMLVVIEFPVFIWNSLDLIILVVHNFLGWIQL